MTIGIMLAAAAAATQCTTGEAAKAEILANHEVSRRAHLEGNAALMEPRMADEALIVSNGDISANSREKTLAFFKGYFSRVKYLEWSDAEPPRVHVSPDGQMAWMAVKVRARYLDRTKPEAGEKKFKSSWIATYQRVGCAWKMTGNASAVVDES